ncbi:MAG: hypothetical protein ACFFC1_18880 [Promethearchaeota archaeon]
MITKNVSVRIKKNHKVPFNETYIAIHNFQQKIFLQQKYINSKKKQKIELNIEECERLMNLLNFYVFDGVYEYSKDNMRTYRE